MELEIMTLPHAIPQDLIQAYSHVGNMTSLQMSMHCACTYCLLAAALQEYLTSTQQGVLGIEKSAMEIAQLNQLFSAAISSQTASIEQIYNNAVEATGYVQDRAQWHALCDSA
eukprot:124003-Chlamydomonas_euryale.AAC.9